MSFLGDFVRRCVSLRSTFGFSAHVLFALWFGFVFSIVALVVFSAIAHPFWWTCFSLVISLSDAELSPITSDFDVFNDFALMVLLGLKCLQLWHFSLCSEGIIVFAALLFDAVPCFCQRRSSTSPFSCCRDWILQWRVQAIELKEKAERDKADKADRTLTLPRPLSTGIGTTSPASPDGRNPRASLPAYTPFDPSKADGKSEGKSEGKRDTESKADKDSKTGSQTRLQTQAAAQTPTQTQQQGTPQQQRDSLVPMSLADAQQRMSVSLTPGQAQTQSHALAQAGQSPLMGSSPSMSPITNRHTLPLPLGQLSLKELEKFQLHTHGHGHTHGHSIGMGQTLAPVPEAATPTPPHRSVTHSPQPPGTAQTHSSHSHSGSVAAHSHQQGTPLLSPDSQLAHAHAQSHTPSHGQSIVYNSAGLPALHVSSPSTTSASVPQTLAQGITQFDLVGLSPLGSATPQHQSIFHTPASSDDHMNSPPRKPGALTSIPETPTAQTTATAAATTTASVSTPPHPGSISQTRTTRDGLPIYVPPGSLPSPDQSISGRKHKSSESEDMEHKHKDSIGGEKDKTTDTEKEKGDKDKDKERDKASRRSSLTVLEAHRLSPRIGSKPLLDKAISLSPLTRPLPPLMPLKQSSKVKLEALSITPQQQQQQQQAGQQQGQTQPGPLSPGHRSHLTIGDGLAAFFVPTSGAASAPSSARGSTISVADAHAQGQGLIPTQTPTQTHTLPHAPSSSIQLHSRTPSGLPLHPNAKDTHGQTQTQTGTHARTLTQQLLETVIARSDSPEDVGMPGLSLRISFNSRKDSDTKDKETDKDKGKETEGKGTQTDKSVQGQKRGSQIQTFDPSSSIPTPSSKLQTLGQRHTQTPTKEKEREKEKGMSKKPSLSLTKEVDLVLAEPATPMVGAAKPHTQPSPSQTLHTQTPTHLQTHAQTNGQAQTQTQAQTHGQTQTGVHAHTQLHGLTSDLTSITTDLKELGLAPLLITKPKTFTFEVESKDKDTDKTKQAETEDKERGKDKETKEKAEREMETERKDREQDLPEHKRVDSGDKTGKRDSERDKDKEKDKESKDSKDFHLAPDPNALSLDTQRSFAPSSAPQTHRDTQRDTQRDPEATRKAWDRALATSLVDRERVVANEQKQVRVCVGVLVCLCVSFVLLFAIIYARFARLALPEDIFVVVGCLLVAGFLLPAIFLTAFVLCPCRGRN